ncbi:hypothetical protein [Thiomonas sp.]
MPGSAKSIGNTGVGVGGNVLPSGWPLASFSTAFFVNAVASEDACPDKADGGAAVSGAAGSGLAGAPGTGICRPITVAKGSAAAVDEGPLPPLAAWLEGGLAATEFIASGAMTIPHALLVHPASSKNHAII